MRGPASAFAEAGGLKRMVRGSEADEVIHHTHTPVLVYRSSVTSTASAGTKKAGANHGASA